MCALPGRTIVDGAVDRLEGLAQLQLREGQTSALLQRTLFQSREMKRSHGGAGATLPPGNETNCACNGMLKARHAWKHEGREVKTCLDSSKVLGTGKIAIKGLGEYPLYRSPEDVPPCGGSRSHREMKVLLLGLPASSCAQVVSIARAQLRHHIKARS